MSVQKISFSNNVTFRGDNTKETQAEVSKKPDEIKDGKKKLALALGGLAAVGIGAVLILRNKKVPSELNLKKFKKIGKFENGKAILKAKNEPFTGIIKVSNKNGDFDIEYANGILQSSTQFVTTGKGEDAVVSAFQKVYSYNDNGKLAEVSRYKYYAADGKTSFSLADLADADFVKNNLARIEDSRMKITDRKISIRKLSPEHNEVLMNNTYFKEDGSFDGAVEGHRKIDKDTIPNAIEEALKKTMFN